MAPDHHRRVRHPDGHAQGPHRRPTGDAILAGVGVGVFDDFSIAKEWCTYREHLEPDQQNHDMYMEYFQLYKNIYANVQGNFQDLQLIVCRHQNERGVIALPAGTVSTGPATVGHDTDPKTHFSPLSRRPQ